MNIVLCGMMASGKSSVGMCLAGKLKRAWTDTDEVIVSRYGKINDIFEYYGEKYFRDLETRIINEAAEKDGIIISTGGGAVLRIENSAALKKNGKLFYLKATAETLVSRLPGGDAARPLLGANSYDATLNRLNKLLQERGHIYEFVADYTVVVDGKTVEEISDEIISLLGDAVGEEQA